MPRRVTLPTLLVFFACAASTAVAESLPVKTVEFSADSVGRKMKYNIVLPEGYDSSDQRYPVLYLLHGLGGNYTGWARMNVPQFAGSYKLIVVMPDVGNTWYVNWSKSDEGQKNLWEDFVVKDLIGHVDATYRTVASRSGRAINGLSMGGYGAMMLGLRHPDMFCSIGSHSGALNYAQRMSGSLAEGGPPRATRREPSDEPNNRIGIEGFSSPRERTPKGKIFATAEECDAHDPFKLVLKVDREKLPHIYVDCGTDDRLIAASRNFAKLLMENDIPFTFAQSPGAHAPPYWSREVGQSMAVQNAILQRNLPRASRDAAASAGAK